MTERVPERDTHHNDVHLVGRLAAPCEQRTLPSGDALTSFRLVVARPAGEPGQPVDTIDCVALRADVQRHALRWHPGDVLELSGSLRHRFWRTPAGPASRYEVVARAVRRQRPRCS